MSSQLACPGANCSSAPEHKPAAGVPEQAPPPMEDQEQPGRSLQGGDHTPGVAVLAHASAEVAADVQAWFPAPAVNSSLQTQPGIAWQAAIVARSTAGTAKQASAEEQVPCSASPVQARKSIAQFAESAGEGEGETKFPAT